MISVRTKLRRGWQSLLEDTLLRRMLANSGWLLGANGAKVPLGFLQSMLVARLLGVEQYGVFGIIVTFVDVVNRLTSFRMNEFVVKYVSDALVKNRLDLAASTIKAGMLAEGCASLLSFVIVCLLAPLATRWFVGVPGSHVLIYTYAIVILGNGIIETTTGTLQVFDRFRLLAVTDLLTKVLTLSGIVIVYVGQGGLWGVILAYALGTILSAFFMVILAFRETTKRLGLSWWRAPLAHLRQDIGRMRKFAVTTNVGGTLSLIVHDSESLWLGFLRNPVEVGYYSLAKSLVKLIVIPGVPLVKAIYPEIARTIAAGQRRRTKNLLFKGALIASAWILPIGIGFVLISPWFIEFFYSVEFLPTVPALIVLLLGIGFVNVMFWTRPALLALGRPDVPLKITLLQAILKVPFVLILVPLHGYLLMAAIQSGLLILGKCLAANAVLIGLRQLRTFPTPVTSMISS